MEERGERDDTGEKKTVTYNSYDDAGAVVEEYTYDIYGKAYRPLGTPITGTWTSVSYDGGTGLTTFTDTGLSLTAGEFKGGLVILNDSAGGNHQYKQFVIFDNGTDNIKILGDVDSIGLKPYSILARAYAVQGSGVGNVILFQGRRLDAESGLYYFRNRQYDPVHGRFLSRDPLGYQDSFCLYQFVNNNPVCYTDPKGLVKWGPVIEKLVDKSSLSGGSLNMESDRASHKLECDTCEELSDNHKVIAARWAPASLVLTLADVTIEIHWSYTGVSIYEAHYEFRAGSWVGMTVAINCTAEFFDGGVKISEGCECGCGKVAALRNVITCKIKQTILFITTETVLPKASGFIYGDGTYKPG